MSAKRKNSRSADLRLICIQGVPKMIEASIVNHPLITPCVFNSELRGYYREGIM